MISPTDMLLPAPSVEEADGAFLRPDMTPLGATVRVPMYAGSACGDRITLAWTGGPSNDGRWTSVQILTAADDDIVFRVPYLVVAAAESYSVTAHYVVQRVGTQIDDTSSPVVLAVENYPVFSFLSVHDENDAPTDTLPHDATWFEARFPEEISRSLNEGDEVVLWVRGVVSQLGSSMIEAASTVWRLPITATNEGEPVSHRFTREIIAANYGDAMLLCTAIVRKSGYIQYPMADFEVTIEPADEILGAVRTDELSADELVLETWEAGRGLAVSTVNQEQLKGTDVRFYLAGTPTPPYPGGEGALVHGTIDRAVLDGHADTDCHLHCEATMQDGSGTETIVARSQRRIVTIRRKAMTDPLPGFDPSFAAPSLDNVPFGRLDPTQFPGGPLARIPASSGIGEGDAVTLFFRFPAGVTAWKDSFVVGNSATDDLVRRIPPWFVAYAQGQTCWLYYSVARGADTRYSPASTIALGIYVPRTYYFYACKMRDKDDLDVSECAPDQPPRLVVQNEVLRLVPGDVLVATVLGHTWGLSATIETTIQDEPADWIFVDLPASLVERNAGHSIRYRVTKIRSGYIDHSPFATLTVHPRDEVLG